MYDKVANKLINDLNLPADIFDIEYEGLKASPPDDKNIFYELIGNLAKDFKGHYYINHFKENRESIVLVINASEINPYINAINGVLAENDIETLEDEVKEPTFRNTDAEIFLAVIPFKEIVEIHLTRKTPV